MSNALEVLIKCESFGYHGRNVTADSDFAKCKWMDLLDDPSFGEPRLSTVNSAALYTFDAVHEVHYNSKSAPEKYGISMCGVDFRLHYNHPR